VRQELRHHQQRVEDADGGQEGARHGELEEAQAIADLARRGIGHQQVGRGADQGRHAAEDAHVGQRHEDPARPGAGAVRKRRHDGYEDHDDRRVVHEGAGYRRHEQQKQQGGLPRPPPLGNDPDRQLLQRAGLVQRLADHQQRQDGDQGRVGEAGQNVLGRDDGQRPRAR
jgi:hypothetical protein